MKTLSLLLRGLCALWRAAEAALGRRGGALLGRLDLFAADAALWDAVFRVAVEEDQVQRPVGVLLFDVRVEERRIVAGDRRLDFVTHGELARLELAVPLVERDLQPLERDKVRRGRARAEGLQRLGHGGKVRALRRDERGSVGPELFGHGNDGRVRVLKRAVDTRLRGPRRLCNGRRHGLGVCVRVRGRAPPEQRQRPPQPPVRIVAEVRLGAEAVDSVCPAENATACAVAVEAPDVRVHAEREVQGSARQVGLRGRGVFVATHSLRRVGKARGDVQHVAWPEDAVDERLGELGPGQQIFAFAAR
mmetsp:Transcript_14910/g.49967  ORF Transcript_14910/g.49967 Transcript_14910/m.49967 type:complete len:305 (-) Transcript_14910:653-1567(-)